MASGTYEPQYMNILLEPDTKTKSSKESRRPQRVVDVCANIFASLSLHRLDFLHSGHTGTLWRTKGKADGPRQCIRWLQRSLGPEENQRQSATEWCSRIRTFEHFVPRETLPKSRIGLSSLDVLLFIFAD